MQPFDALTMKAVLHEARSLLINRKVEKVHQLGRDEVIIALRSKAGTGYFLLSAQASFGRLCLINLPSLPKANTPPPFCQLLRKHLTGAILVGVEQLPGERIADLTFACMDELGNKSLKVLTAEIMGRHSNLIFWDKESQKIIGASHVVTQEMSRQREVQQGIPYVRPPQQEKPSIFNLSANQFASLFDSLASNPPNPNDTAAPASVEQWLLMSMAGLGRHLAEEIVFAAQVESSLHPSNLTDTTRDLLWRQIDRLQNHNQYKPAMRHDLTRYSVLSWWQEAGADTAAEEWKHFPAVNDMIEDYFRTLQQREQMQQLKDRIRSELRSESDKLEARLAAARKQLETSQDFTKFKTFGDLILANVHDINPGQSVLSCANLFDNEGNGNKLEIELNPNLSAAQNAQNYYRQFAKARVRQKTADAAQADALSRLATVRGHLDALDKAQTAEELDRLKQLVLERGKRAEQKPQQQSRGGGNAGGGQQKQQQQHQKQQQHQQQQGAAGSKQQRLMNTKSSDGWTIIVGRNRNENDVLISKLAQPLDIWLHVLGQEGAHVLIKNSNRQDPPQTTLQEAAQIAARFSRVSLGSKVRVVYTQARHVRKIAKDKPGLVRYENERTIEVDTAAPMPPSLRRLFQR